MPCKKQRSNAIKINCRQYGNLQMFGVTAIPNGRELRNNPNFQPKAGRGKSWGTEINPAVTSVFLPNCKVRKHVVRNTPGASGCRAKLQQLSLSFPLCKGGFGTQRKEYFQEATHSHLLKGENLRCVCMWVRVGKRLIILAILHI